MIIKNVIRCNLCGDEIESKHRHDYVKCKCGACAVDGGHDYLRRSFSSVSDYTDLSVTLSGAASASQSAKEAPESVDYQIRNATYHVERVFEGNETLSELISKRIINEHSKEKKRDT